MAITKITGASIAADSIDGTKIADDAINSEHITDGGIDNVHLADDAVAVAELSATGTASNTTFLRGDNSWQTAGSTSASDLTSGTLANARLPTNIVDTGTEGTKLAVGTTAQRGSTTGQWRFNTTTGYFEGIGAGGVIASLEPDPVVSSVDDTEVDSAGGGNQTIVVTGSQFSSGGVIAFVGSSAEFNATTTTYNSITQVTAVAPKSSFLNAQEPYKVKFTSASGKAGISSSGLINVDNAPAWSTSAGSLGTVYEDTAMSTISVSATDAEGDTVAYSVQSGAIPTGTTLGSANGQITGTPNVNDTYASGGVTHSFDIRATAGGKTSDRSFSILRKWYDGSTSALAATNANALYTGLSFTSSDDGIYWIKPTGLSAVQVYCEFNSFGGWMLFAQGDGSGSPVYSGTGASGNVTTLLGGTKGKWDDATFNAITWTHVWHGMTDNDTDGTGIGSGKNTMDNNRQNFTTSGNKFTISWVQNNQHSSGTTTNGRNQTWSYKSLTGSGGAAMTGSSRQPSSTITNNQGSTDRAVGNTNSYYIGSHDAGTGGAWIHSSDGSNSFMNEGFGSDYVNVGYDARYSYWFMK
jgi:hypothetical protein